MGKARPRRLARTWAATVVVAVVALAACGSTVQQSARLSGGAASELGSSATSAPASGDGSTDASSSTGAAGGATNGSTGARRAAGASAGGTQATVPRALKAGRTTLDLGVVYLKGLEAAYQAVGAPNAAVDSKADTQAVVDDVNAHGGAAGRKIVTSYYAIDASSSQDRPTQLQAACAYFTQDHPVDMVVSYAGGALIACLAAHGVPLINGYPGAVTGASQFARAPLYTEPSAMSLQRLAQLQPAFLASRHWIDGRWGNDSRCAAVKEPRLGVVTIDDPDHRSAYNDVMAPAFKATGHPVVDVVFLAAGGNTANALASVSTGSQNAILRFAGDCVDHVVFMSAVAVDGLFMLAASQQHYNPRYGFSSQEAPTIAIPSVPDYKAQMAGSIGIGWTPFEDVDVADFDATAAAPAKRCLDVLTKASLRPGDNNAMVLALPSCEGVYAAVEVFTGMVSGSKGFGPALNDVASAYRPQGTYLATINAGRHDGASGYRQFDFVDACGCFRYVSGVQAM